MKNYKVDSHCHSNFSDGERNNRQILEIAKKAGLGFIAVADHDILNKDFPVLAQQSGLKSSEAIEISVNGHNSSEAHLLLYSNKFGNQIERIIGKTRESRIGILENKIDSLNNRTIRTNLVEFYEYFANKGIKPECITLRDLAKYIYSDKKNVKLIKEIFGEHVCYDTFLKEFLDEDGEYGIIGGRIKCYFLPSIEEIIKNIDESKTIISLAHPEHIFKNTHEMKEKIGFYINSGINAIEINSLTSKQWVHAIMHVKNDYNLILTTGSDNHREEKDERHDHIGNQNEELNESIIQENFLKFLSKLNA